MPSACGGGTPESVAEKYCKAIMCADVKTAVKYATASESEDINEILSDAETREFVLKAYDGAKLKLAASEIAEDNESAEVVFDVETAPDSEKENLQMRVSLVKEGGSWKVNRLR